MTHEIITINLNGVNCYLIKTDMRFILIDTGSLSKRANLTKAMGLAGCHEGNLSLVILTHGDSDHADNAAYFQKKYGAKIAIHRDDAGMIERADMSANRKSRPDKTDFVFRLMMLIVPLLIKANKFEITTPDILITEDIGLEDFGLAARVIGLPGHSKGSIGVLTAEGDLFCGDLLYNIFGKPHCLYIDSLSDYQSSLHKLGELKVKTIYPGHGKSFSASIVL